MARQQITVQLPEILLNEIEHHIDGVNFRNRAHVIHAAVAEWLDSRRGKIKKQLSLSDAAHTKKGAPKK